MIWFLKFWYESIRAIYLAKETDKIFGLELLYSLTFYNIQLFISLYINGLTKEIIYVTAFDLRRYM